MWSKKNVYVKLVDCSLHKENNLSAGDEHDASLVSSHERFDVSKSCLTCLDDPAGGRVEERLLTFIGRTQRASFSVSCCGK